MLLNENSEFAIRKSDYSSLLELHYLALLNSYHLHLRRITDIIMPIIITIMPIIHLVTKIQMN